MAVQGWTQRPDGSFVSKDKWIVAADPKNLGWIIVRSPDGVVRRLDPQTSLPSDFPQIPGIQDVVQAVTATAVPAVATPQPTGRDQLPLSNNPPNPYASASPDAPAGNYGFVPQDPGSLTPPRPRGAGSGVPNADPAPTPAPTATATEPPGGRGLSVSQYDAIPAIASPSPSPASTGSPYAASTPVNAPGQPAGDQSTGPNPFSVLGGSALQGTLGSGQLDQVVWDYLNKYSGTNLQNLYQFSSNLGLAPGESETDWLSRSLSLYLPSTVANVLDHQLRLRVGHGLDPKVITQIEQLISTSDPQFQQALITDLLNEGASTTDPFTTSLANFQPLGDLLGPLSGTLGIDQSTGQPGTPEQTPEQILSATRSAERTKFIQDYASLTNTAPSQAIIDQYANAPAAVQAQYLDSIPIYAGLNSTEYASAQKQMDSFYLQYYGRTALPAEIGWAAGKSQSDIQNHLYSGPSRVGGMNLGTYLNYSTALESISQELFGTSASDSMVTQLHQGLQGQGKDFQPSYNPKGGG